MPEEEEPIFDHGVVRERKLNVSVLSLNIKFNYDRILSTLVYLLHNGLSSNITQAQITEISDMIIQYYMYIHNSMNKMNEFYKANPPTTVQEMNLINFIKNHSFSFVDRAMMLLHKKILFGDDTSNEVSAKQSKQGFELNVDKNRGGVLSLSQYEDTFGHIQEANIIKNFNNSSISLLKFNPSEDFSYGNMHNNLIPSILHNLNDFLKYNDFIKFGKYNWYIKRTIPLDSIILMFIIITVKFKYEFFTINELCIYVKLINKALFILNRKWFKNEKYKRMLSLTNLTWEYILKRYNIVQLINQFNDEMPNNRIEFFDYQVKAMVNMNELFDVMDVPQPIDFPYKLDAHGKMPSKRSHSLGSRVNNVSVNSLVLNPESKLELAQLNEKIYYDLRNNFVDVNDYCAFYTSLENILHELMDFMNQQRLE
ncbi:uncharacterized protein SPAPADRAFT_58929 [Spathaspora passalidarum NRRL Y-27907]|uniref:Uncharacterized protein n=1 Tax=Spathaspora passalidarum (strain NRRL Y-27907 / 11-Y1) TaxID=619300 RepID=G3AEE4_SPAPN|nr:uncharacterized protein SPAPADRAFT_58929 [Spathaspora passalidarum NRRL Y-27907]EGW35733.1 hypothetical protein SPAPADRAFT_58929 [Spathaspora passalidarum NRRL Y-27907]